jgi:glyceraldehyde-3-phosphate dehydrogenase (ferredoxin)
MDVKQKVLFVDARTGYYRVGKYPVGDFFGPVDLGLHLAGRFNSLNLGVGLLAGSILPGSNRLVVTGFSPCWGGFYVSSMGGAGLVFDNLGINMLSIVGSAATPSVLVLNRQHGEEVDVSLMPIDLSRVWASGRLGVYALLDEVHARYTPRFSETPRILAVGPAAESTDFGGIVSVPIDGNGALTHIDTWAGRGGFGTRLLRDHKSPPSSTAAPSSTRTSATARWPTSGSRCASRSGWPRRTSRRRRSTASIRGWRPGAPWASTSARSAARCCRSTTAAST